MSQHPESSETPSLSWPKKTFLKNPVLAVVSVVVLAWLLALVWLPKPNLVPPTIRERVNFTVYYPDPGKLPKGYRLDANSFRDTGDAVVYFVYSDQHERLTFTVTQKPSLTALQVFQTQYLPLHVDVHTAIGTASIGSKGNQTVVSLPTQTNAWIFMTAPGRTDRAKLKQVLLSF